MKEKHKTRKCTVTWDERRYEEIKEYARDKDITIPALIKYTLRQHMVRYPIPVSRKEK